LMQAPLALIGSISALIAWRFEGRTAWSGETYRRRCGRVPDSETGSDRLFRVVFPRNAVVVQPKVRNPVRCQRRCRVSGRTYCGPPPQIRCGRCVAPGLSLAVCQAETRAADLSHCSIWSWLIRPACCFTARPPQKDTYHHWRVVNRELSAGLRKQDLDPPATQKLQPWATQHTVSDGSDPAIVPLEGWSRL
jgi:hypothetical protein